MAYSKITKNIFIFLAILSFVSQSLASHAFAHLHSSAESEHSSNFKDHHNFYERFDKSPNTHSHHDMHSSSGIVTSELSNVDGQQAFNHQCCENECDCELANCSNSLASPTYSNFFIARSALINTLKAENKFISLTTPPLFKPPIAS